MSLLDIRHAKEALAWRLKEWGTEGNHAELAASFIDDLVAKGWRMDAMREDRPQPPKVGEECGRCSGPSPCNCTRERRAADWEPDDPNPRPESHADASLARALLLQGKATCCACGVRRSTCPAHRGEQEAS